MIEDLKELEKLLKICRRQGVVEIDFDNVKLKLGDLPLEASSASSAEVNDPLKNFPQGELTPEQLIFYSSGGMPEDDPALKATA